MPARHKIEIGRAGVWPPGYYLYSGRITNSQQIFSGEGVIGGITIKTDGTNDVTTILYDNADDASGAIALDLITPGTDKIGGMLMGNIPIKVEMGCFLSISGSGGSCIIYYR